MLEVLHDPVSATAWCQKQRQLGRSIGFVPTMGALHQGHLSLVKRSIVENDVTCASIFVNPLQFNDSSDYESYPRDFGVDHRLLEDNGCDMLFSGSNRDMFPEASSLEDVRLLDPGLAGKGLEGRFRPGHLEGVCTVVDRLFKFVGECKAYFGLKDYQQTLVIQDLAEKLGYPEIRTCETVRDQHGLALSSRNSLLGAQEIEIARSISRALFQAKQLWQTGCHDCDQLRAAMRAMLLPPLKVDYAEIRDPLNWQPESPHGTVDRAIALIAATIADVRLIDNLRLDA